MRFILFIYLLQFIFSSNLNSFGERIVTIGGSVTDIVFALGMGNSVVAVDQSSTLPTKVKDLPQVGYVRSISAEGISSMSPTKILTSSDIGPPNVIDQLNESGVEFKIFDSPLTFNELFNFVDSIALFLDIEESGHKLKDDLSSDLNSIQDIKLDKSNLDLNMVFFMNPSSNSFNAAGSGTRASYLINFVGGKNIFDQNFQKYNKVDKETIIASNPDVILIGSMSTTPNINCIFKSDPTFSNISAIKKDKVIYLDLGYHLTFGSKFGEASILLLDLIYNDNQ